MQVSPFQSFFYTYPSIKEEMKVGLIKRIKPIFYTRLGLDEGMEVEIRILVVEYETMAWNTKYWYFMQVEKFGKHAQCLWSKTDILIVTLGHKFPILFEAWREQQILLFIYFRKSKLWKVLNFPVFRFCTFHENKYKLGARTFKLSIIGKFLTPFFSILLAVWR